MEKLTSVGSGFAVDDVRYACQDFDYDFKVAFFRWLICKKKSCFVNSNSFFFQKIFFYEWNDSEYILLWMNEGETWKFIVPVCVSYIIQVH